jgi:hypothetical protein
MRLNSSPRLPALLARLPARRAALFLLACLPAPRWVQAAVRSGFRSPAGALAVAGLSGCPLWAFTRCRLPLGSA